MSFGMSFYNPSAIDNFSDLRTLPFNLASGSAYLTFYDPALKQGGSSDGTITSIGLDPTSVPEPSAFAIFLVLGAVAVARRRLKS